MRFRKYRMQAVLLYIVGDCYVLAIIFEKIVVQYYRNLYKQRRVNAFALEYAVYVCSVAVQLFCKPGHTFSPFVKYFLDYASDMNHRRDCMILDSSDKFLSLAQK